MLIVAEDWARGPVGVWWYKSASLLTQWGVRRWHALRRISGRADDCPSATVPIVCCRFGLCVLAGLQRGAFVKRLWLGRSGRLHCLWHCAGGPVESVWYVRRRLCSSRWCRAAFVGAKSVSIRACLRCFVFCFLLQTLCSKIIIQLKTLSAQSKMQVSGRLPVREELRRDVPRLFK